MSRIAIDPGFAIEDWDEIDEMQVIKTPDTYPPGILDTLYQLSGDGMSLIAIDPGANGGFAIEDSDEIQVIKMPDTYPGIFDTLNKLRMDIIRPSVVIEDVGYHVQGNNASASCKFARHVGHLEMALYAVNMPVQRVRPVKWQRMFTLPKNKRERKRKMKELMAAQYPYIKVTDWNADALGILTWALKEGE